MACPEFEQNILGYAELDRELRQRVDVHLSECASCSTFRSTLEELDERLPSELAAALQAPALEEAVRHRIHDTEVERRPSWAPEALDLIGWAAVLVVGSFLLAPLLP